MSPSPVIARRRIRRPPRRFPWAQPDAETCSHLYRSHDGYTRSRAHVPAIRYALVVTAAWLIATVNLFRVSRSTSCQSPPISVQMELQSVYEDRIAQFRAQVDRIISQKLLDQEQVEQRVNALLQRQAHISLLLDKVEQKQAATLTDLEERVDTRARQMHSVLTELGINVGRAAAEGSIGGPFVRSCHRNRPLAPSKLNSIASIWAARRSTVTATRWSHSQYANL